jgi:hypothetical protein
MFFTQPFPAGLLDMLLNAPRTQKGRNAAQAEGPLT